MWKTTSGRAAATAASTAAWLATVPWIDRISGSSERRREKPVTSAPSERSHSDSQRPLKPLWPVTSTRRPAQNVSEMALTGEPL